MTKLNKNAATTRTSIVSISSCQYQQGLQKEYTVQSHLSVRFYTDNTL